MEQASPRRRPPRPKLKMPLIGNMLGGSSNSSAKDPSFLSSKLTPLIVGVVIIIYAIDYVRSKNDTHRVYQGVSDIKEMAWDGKVAKKWVNIIPPDNEIHYMFQIIDAKGEVKTVDLGDEKAGLGDLMMPKNTLIKKAGSFDVTVKRYFKNDTTIVLKY
ncbi:hypothetical protein VB264_18515 [Arcicella aquatica]|uniref:Uncharacterized protein n=1 Tax=Arcicella aquatica TaxID=217141 RepID=A0ABU5QRT6_9BACT|nr:hypothetical protein [Arcicella aquatica]MEA5259797.1 hypothetical protein [Arcicella aquatica]